MSEFALNFLPKVGMFLDCVRDGFIKGASRDVVEGGIVKQRCHPDAITVGALKRTRERVGREADILTKCFVFNTRPGNHGLFLNKKRFLHLLLAT